jgi:erythromycin esterase
MSKRYAVLWALMCLASSSRVARGQADLNLSFETRAQIPTRPAGWDVFGEGAEVTLDETSPHDGKYALKVQCFQAPRGGAHVCLPVTVVAGKTLMLSCWIRTNGMPTDEARVWCHSYRRADDPKYHCKLLAAANIVQTGMTGVTGWMRHQLATEIPRDAIEVYISAEATGRGTAWFDDFQLLVNEQSFAEAYRSVYEEMTSSQEGWLRQNCSTLSTVNPDAGFEDLAPVRQMIGNIPIVALGEATHGAKQFFQLKHRLIRFLASEMGFTVLAIEAGMAETEALNEYVLTGRGNLDQVLADMFAPMYRSDELRELFTWMRDFNKTSRKKLQVKGICSSQLPYSFASLRTALKKVDPPAAKELNDQVLKMFSRKQLTVRDMRTALSKVASELIRHYQDPAVVRALGGPNRQIDLIIQHAQVMEQGLIVYRYFEDPDFVSDCPFRDRCMAENFERIRTQVGPEEKVILWAHNMHVARAKGKMGFHLSARHKRQMLVLALTCHEGRYVAPSAVDRSSDVNVYQLTPSFLGTLEWNFQKLDRQCVFLNFAHARRDNADCAWLFRNLGLRRVGSAYTEGQFDDSRVAEEFDGIFFVRKTSEATIGGRARKLLSP